MIRVSSHWRGAPPLSHLVQPALAAEARALANQLGADVVLTPDGATLRTGITLGAELLGAQAGTLRARIARARP
jgi:hypothetical protein